MATPVKELRRVAADVYGLGTPAIILHYLPPGGNQVLNPIVVSDDSSDVSQVSSHQQAGSRNSSSITLRTEGMSGAAGDGSRALGRRDQAELPHGHTVRSPRGGNPSPYLLRGEPAAL